MKRAGHRKHIFFSVMPTEVGTQTNIHKLVVEA